MSGLYPVTVRVTPVQGRSSFLPPLVAYQDYLKDLEAYNRYNMSYTTYIECVIDKLSEGIDSQPTDTSASDNLTRHMSQIDAHECLPDSLTPMFTINQGPDCFKEDAYIATKQFVLLRHCPLNFKFIGPDQEPVVVETVEQCVKVADIIRNTGLPNYKMVRITLK